MKSAAIGIFAIGSTLTVAPAAGAVPGSEFVAENEFGTSATIPVAWGDFDGDGDFDLAVGNFFNQANELYVNEGGNVFTRSTPFGNGSTFALAWADYDNDGDLDLAVGNDGVNWLYTQGPAGVFTQSTPFGASRTVAIAWADADADGDLDLAIGNGILGIAQQNVLYRNDGGGAFTALDRFGIGETDSLAWGDFDGDGDLDLAVGNGGFNSAEANALYRNDGGLAFTAFAQFGEGDTSVVACADANGDGILDLAVGNWETGDNALYTGNGDGTFVMTSAFGARDTNTIAWGDFDLDGDLDLAVGNGDFFAADQNYLYENDGAGGFTEIAEFGGDSTDGVAWADSDGDGDLDLAVGNEHTTTQNALWINQLGAADWLRVHLVGRFHAFGAGYSNRNGVGATVTVYEAGHLGEDAFRLGRQSVVAAGGFQSQNAIALTFGVPGQSTVDVEIAWPGSNGVAHVQSVFGVGMDQAVTVNETKPGDLNDDGVVTFADLLLVLGAWGPCPGCPEDLNGDGDVTFADLLIVLGQWG